MLRKRFSQPAYVCSGADFINTSALASPLPTPSASSGGGAGGADATVPGRTGFIYCLWPEAGAVRGPHKFPPA